MEKRLNVYPHFQFDMEMMKNGWKTNVPENVAVISICNVNDGTVHYFPMSSENILNVDFDDVGENEINCLDIQTAKTIVDFIEKNIGKDFYIHCTAGKSRSQGIARFILDMYPDYNYQTRSNNPCLTPNYHVVATLKRILYNYDC